jgi:choline dehydrogenase-like flavoprotein
LPDPLALAGIIEEELALGVAPEAEPLLSGFLGDIALFGVGELFKNVPVEYYHLSTRIDPVPDPDSRITLTTERDQLGQNRAQLDWRLNPLDKHSARRTLEVLAAELGQAGLGRLQIDLDDDDTTWPEDLAGGSHHMGTTRMSDDPKQGVVDKNCQVYGLSNLFIAGSSVFPTGGSGTPTLTLVALTLRLAEHIKERMND